MMSSQFKSMLAAIALVVALLQPACAQKRVALVIGNNAYRNVPALVTAAADARTVADTLRHIGFVVDAVEDATLAETRQRLRAFESTIEPGDMAFFFFAGHGIEIRGRNYLLPVDVPAATEDGPVIAASLAPDLMLERLSGRRAGVAVVVLDACRDNPFEADGRRSLAGGLASMLPPEQTFILYSAGVQQTALDRLDDNDKNPNSVFTRTFARELARSGRTMVQIAKVTQAEVKRTAATVRHNQAPAYYDRIIGDLVLSAPASDNPAR